MKEIKQDVVLDDHHCSDETLAKDLLPDQNIPTLKQDEELQAPLGDQQVHDPLGHDAN